MRAGGAFAVSGNKHPFWEDFAVHKTKRRVLPSF
jgi:hypothetical protein